MQAEDPPQYTDSGRGVHGGSDNWWREVLSLQGSTLSSSTRGTVARLAGARRCLLTREEKPHRSIQVCHLVPRSAKPHTLKRIQYVFGRRFSPDNRWNMFLLKSDFHTSFDEDEWALVPELDLVRKIVGKITDELAKRNAPNSAKGAWPDFRSKEWFPIERNKRFNYIFVTLTLGLDDVPLNRREWESGPSVRTPYAPPGYHGFPVLTSHVHPFMVIMNAAPKLKQHPKLFDQAHPVELRESIEFIYDTWMASAQYVGPESSSRTQSTGSGREGLCSQHSGRSQRGVSGQTNANTTAEKPNGNLGGQGTTGHQIDSYSGDFFGLGGEFGGVDQDFDASTSSSRSSLSISAPDESITNPDHVMSPRTSDSSPRCDSRPSKLEEAAVRTGPAVCMPKDLYDWVDGTNLAREDKKLCAVHNLPEQLEHYAAEPVRVPYEGDWHEWTSEFAPRDVPADGSVLSSNDWVVVSDLLPLTRALSSHT